MRKICGLIIMLVVVASPVAKADLFGGDVAVLVQIYANAIEQLVQLKNMLQTSQDSLSLVRDINRGINDSLNIMRTISPNRDPGLYKDWNQVSDALNKLETIYGVAVESRDSRLQKDTDKSVAEAVTLNNSIYKYTAQIDEIGEQIKDQSHNVSPGGAAKLTAQSLGVMLNLQNEMLRTQATGLKLQAEAMAIQNKKDKERTRQMVEGADGINSALANQDTNFQLPRFE